MDDRLRGRIDPSDVIQEAFLAATRQMPDYLEHDEMPFYIWLRLIAAQKLVGLHRHHLHVKARNARRDVRFFNAQLPDASSALLAAQLLGTRHRSEPGGHPGGAAATSPRTSWMEWIRPIEKSSSCGISSN